MAIEGRVQQCEHPRLQAAIAIAGAAQVDAASRIRRIRLPGLAALLAFLSRAGTAGSAGTVPSNLALASALAAARGAASN
ncbi:hypothetical protein CSC66_08790 [Pseudoxanthomonas kaohsiungensis]|nr:hypothetical protein CSC66_08790 [Pseudoxanthomonas kaohsiungensis]